MADTSNLSKFLTDVADAIRTKKETTEPIPAADFDSEILSIEGGIDTSDATATSNDIIADKTAYVNGQKLTGAIEATYKDASAQGFTSSETVDTTLKYVGGKYFVKMTSTMIYVLKLEGTVLNLITSYALSDLSSYNSTSYTRGDCSIYSTKNNDIRFIIPAANGNGTIYYLRFDANTNVISLITSVTPCTPMYGTAVHAKFPNHTNDYFMFWSEQCNYGGIDKQIVLSYTITATSMSMKTVLFNSKFYGNTASNVHFAHNDNLFCLTRTTTVDNQSSVKQYQYVLDDTFNLLSTNYSTYDYRNMVISDKGNYGYLGGNIYSISYTSANVPVIGDIIATATETIQGLFALDYVKTTTSIVNKIYKINENGTLEEKISTGNSLITNRDYRGIIQVVSGTEGLLIENLASLGEKVITKMIRDTISYYDSADANVLASDILIGKTAYGANGKIIGTIPDYGAGLNTGIETITPNVGYDGSFIEFKSPEQDGPFAFATDKVRLMMTPRMSEVANAVGLTGDKLVKGNTVLGVEGTAEAGAAEVQFKLYETMDEMYADTDVKENDLAIVYRNDIRNATQDSVFSQAIFPSTVVLPTAVTANSNVRYEAADSSKMFDCWGNMSSTEFYMSCYGDAGSIDIRYESSDGITYTRADDGEELIDFGMNIRYSTYAEWIPAIGYFIQVSTDIYDGFFKCMNYDDKNFITMYKGITYSYEDTNLVVHHAETGAFPIHKYFDVIDNVRRDAGITSYGSMLCSYSESNPDMLSLYYYKYSSTSDNCHHLDLSTDDGSEIYISTTSDSTGTVYEKLDIRLSTGEYQKTAITSIKTIVNDIIHVFDVLPEDNYVFMVYTTGEIQWADNIRFETYTSTHGTGQYDYSYDYLPNVPENKTGYIIAPSQLTLANSNELLPGVIGYGKNGAVTGDTSVYDNLDYSLVSEQLGLTKHTSLTITRPTVESRKLYSLCNTNIETEASTYYRPMKYAMNPKYAFDTSLITFTGDSTETSYKRQSAAFKCENNYNCQLCIGSKTFNAYIVVYDDDNAIVDAKLLFTGTSSSNGIKQKVVVDDNYYYFSAQCKTTHAIAKVNRVDGAIEVKTFTVPVSVLSYQSENMIFTELNGNLVYIDSDSSGKGNVLYITKNLEVIKNISYTYPDAYASEYPSTAVIIGNSIFWTIRCKLNRLFKFDGSSVTYSGEIGTGTGIAGAKHMFTDGTYIYVTWSSAGGVYKLNTSLNLVETLPGDYYSVLYNNLHYYDFDITDYGNYTCYDAYGHKHVIKDRVEVLQNNTLCENELTGTTQVTNGKKLKDVMLNFKCMASPVLAEIREGVYSDAYNTVVTENGNTILYFTSLFKGEPSLLSVQEYNSAVNTANEILGEEV